MTRTATVYQMNYRNPHASAPLVLPVLVLCNTPDEVIAANVRANSARDDLEWVAFEEPHGYTAVIVGGGPSMADHVDAINRLADKPTTWIFALNGASAFLTGQGIPVDYQVIADAKPETATLIDPEANEHLIASQCDPACFGKAMVPTLWHLATDGIEDNFPADRRARGGYALVGGGAAVGNSALCLAYVMGFRRFEIFGMDSSHREGASHAYDQPMNRFIPTVDVEWGGKTYTSSVAMKAQAEKFQITGQMLKQAGCKLTVHGDGLLPAMWNTPKENLSERNKYQLVWQFDCYREYSPGEQAVETFIEVAKPHGLIIDFGCGTGRASLELARRGHDVLLIDFADNSRDDAAIDLPFIEWDLTKPCPARGNFGLCCDVMEHIPPGDVATVIRNIMDAGRSVFFQISTVKDSFGALIGADLHLTVRDHKFWRGQFAGYAIAWEAPGEGVSQFLVNAIPQTE